MLNNFSKSGKITRKGGLPLQTIQKSPPEVLVRQTWLHYYNDYLRERGVITEEEWRKMRRLIEQH